MAALADDRKAIDIRAYDVRGLTLVADSFLICAASSEPQFKAVCSAIREGMREVGVKPLRVEGSTKGEWVILDYGTIICHVFREKARAYYDLDALWADAPQIPLDLET